MLKYSIFLLFVFYSFSVVHASAQTWSTVPGAYGIAFDTDGNLFVSSTTQNEIVELYEGLGVPVRFAGTGTAGFVDGDALTEAQFNQPKGIIVYENSVYVCDYGNNAIRKIFNGQVSTLVSDVTGPVDISVVGNFNYYSYWYWYNSNEQYVNPKGLYVTTDSGEVYFINEGPENDDCPYSQALGTLSSTPFVVHGTTIDASGVTSVPTCPAGSNNIPFTPVWYSFMGNGNGVNITTCLSGTNSYAGVFVYRDPAPNSNTTCNHLVCMGENFHNDCGIVSLCTQVNMRYYVVVSSPYESEEGPFELSITDIGSNLCADCSCDGIECGNNACGGFCPNPGCTGGKVCVAGKCEGEAVNANCTGAIVIPSTNTSVSANTQFSVGPVPYIPAEGDCYFPENSGLWYSFVGTGTQVTLTTCSPVTDYDTIIHVYKSIDYYDSCGQFLCITENDDYSCRYDGTDSRVDFCSENGTVYYYFVEGFGHGAFQLTQTISPMACTPGDYWEYYFFYWDFFYWDFFYVFYFDEVTGLPITDQSPPKQLPIINDK